MERAINKSLFEIITGATGVSYERAYCWAPSELGARVLFSASYPEKNIATIVKVFDATNDILLWAPDQEGFSETPPKSIPATYV